MTRRLPSRRTLTGVGLSLLAASIAWLSARGADSPEAREIKARFKKQADRIESLEVSFRREATSPLKAEQLLALAEFRNQLWLPKDRWQVAFKGRKRFQRQLNPERLTPLGRTDEFGMTPPPPVDPKSPALVQENQKKLIKEYERMVAMMKAEKARGTNRIQFDNQPERDVTRAYNGRTLWMRHPDSDKVDAYQIWSVELQGQLVPGHSLHAGGRSAPARSDGSRPGREGPGDVPGRGPGRRSRLPARGHDGSRRRLDVRHPQGEPEFPAPAGHDRRGSHRPALAGPRPRARRPQARVRQGWTDRNALDQHRAARGRARSLAAVPLPPGDLRRGCPPGVEGQAGDDRGDHASRRSTSTRFPTTCST